MSMPLMCIAASPAGEWSGVGTAEQVTVDDSAIVLTSSDAETAGGLSSTIEFSGADAALVTATIANATERSVTFALQDASNGASVGYWQNPVAFATEQRVAAVLPIARNIDPGVRGYAHTPASERTREDPDTMRLDSNSPVVVDASEHSEDPDSVRFFAGTHRHASNATISNIAHQPIRAGDGARGSIWGTWVDGTRDQCQTFVASGALKAVTLRLRHFQPGQTSGGLRVHVYEWTGEIAPSRRGKPLAEAVLPAELIPPGEEGNERDVSIAIDAPTQAGKTYLLSFSLAEGKQEQSLLLWAGPDDNAAGQLFENDSPKIDWDLYFATYYAH